MIELIPVIGLYRTLLLIGYPPHQAEKIVQAQA